MFCPKCGIKCEENWKFCEECGTELPKKEDKNGLFENVSTLPSLSKMKESFVGQFFPQIAFNYKKYKKALIPLVAVGAIIIAFYSIGSYLSSPKRTAENYFGYLVESDWKSAFKYLSLTEDDFINEVSFEKYMENYASDYSYILSFNVNEDKRSDDSKVNSLVRKYNIDYASSRPPVEGSTYVILTKQKEKSLFFFSKYKVSTESMAEAFEIYVPEKTVIYFDDLELNENCDEYIGVSETPNQMYNNAGVAYVKYKIPLVFNCYHNLYFEYPGNEDYEIDLDTSLSHYYVFDSFKSNG